MKSYILGTFLICSLILNLFQLMDNETIVYDDLSSELGHDIKVAQKKDLVNTGQASIKNNSKLVNNKSHKGNLGKFKESVLGVTPDESESGPMLKTHINEQFIESEIDKAKEVWREKATDYFVGELRFDAEQIEEYFSIGNEREAQISEYLQEKIDGESTFIYTVENMVEENEINLKFLKKMKELFGEAGYEKYKVYRDKYNQEMMDRDEGYFPIEL